MFASQLACGHPQAEPPAGLLLTLKCQPLVLRVVLLGIWHSNAVRTLLRFVVLLVAWLFIGLVVLASATSSTGQVSWGLLAAFVVWVALWTVSYWLRARAGVETSGWLNFIYGPAGIIRDIVVSLRKLRRDRT